jgi:RNA polymerase subunit RPABC4/transcription elongation factor Spt4
MLVKEGNKCLGCGGESLTDRYNGMITIFDFEKSKVAQMLGAKMPGNYAVRMK